MLRVILKRCVVDYIKERSVKESKISCKVVQMYDS